MSRVVSLRDAAAGASVGPEAAAPGHRRHLRGSRRGRAREELALYPHAKVWAHQLRRQPGANCGPASGPDACGPTASS